MQREVAMLCVIAFHAAISAAGGAPSTKQRNILYIYLLAKCLLVVETPPNKLSELETDAFSL